MRYTAIFAIATMFCIILGTHIFIGNRSKVVFLQELKTHGHLVMELTSSRIEAKLKQDQQLLENFLHQSVDFGRNGRDDLERLARSYTERAPYIDAIGLIGWDNIHIQSNSKRTVMRSTVEDHIAFDGMNIPSPSLSMLGNDRVVALIALPNAAPRERVHSPLLAYFVMDIAQLLNAAGTGSAIFDITDEENFLYGLRDVSTGQLLAGKPDAALQDALYNPVGAEGLLWEVVGRPADGWNRPPNIHADFNFALLIASVATLLPMFIAALLLIERNSNIDALQTREAKLLDVSKRFKLAMDASAIGLWEMDPIDGLIFMDQRSSILHGTGSKECRCDISSWVNTIHPEDKAAVEVFLFNCACSDSTFTQVYRVLNRDGSVSYLRAAGANYQSSDGKSRTTGIIWDVSADMRMASNLREAKFNSDLKNAELELALNELSNREHELAELSGRLNLALESYNCGTWQIDPYTVTATWDERMHQLYDLVKPVDEPVTLDQFLGCIHPDDHFRVVEAGEKPGAPATHRVLTRDKEVRYIRTVGQTYRNQDGKKRVVGLSFDITADVLLSEQLKLAKDEAEAKNSELEIAKNRIEHNALHDPLTGLANRRKLDVALDRLAIQSVTENQNFAILHLDLDRFKQINDTLGHAAGDAMLAHTARILKENIRNDDLVARIGGDEFVILVENARDRDKIKSMAARIITELNQPLMYNNVPCRCGVSIGIAFGAGFQINTRSILINADIALYRAKAQGRNCFEFFTQDLQSEIINNKRIADEILSGLENDEFEAWYQPQICARTHKLIGAEALVRWRHPERGILTPDQFLRVAEDINVVATLDNVVLKQGLQEKRLWDLHQLDIEKLSVNVSARRLNDSSLLSSLKDIGFGKGEVAFELVESIFLDDLDQLAVGNIEGLKELGIDIEIDDFGTGHTSIISLLKLKPKRLKIDRQLVTPIVGSTQERKLVRSIIEIASSLGIETIAEGVETTDHALILSQMGCDVLQGYHFSKPLPPRDFIAFARKEEWRKAS